MEYFLIWFLSMMKSNSLQSNFDLPRKNGPSSFVQRCIKKNRAEINRQSTISKLPPKKIFYRDYNNFSFEWFNSKLWHAVCSQIQILIYLIFNANSMHSIQWFSIFNGLIQCSIKQFNIQRHKKYSTVNSTAQKKYSTASSTARNLDCSGSNANPS